MLFTALMSFENCTVVIDAFGLSQSLPMSGPPLECRERLLAKRRVALSV
jgi:hypothetical protein